MSRNPRRIDEATEALVCDLYLAGETIKVISQKTGVSRFTVQSVVERNGLPRRRGVRQDESPPMCVRCTRYEPVEGYVLCVKCRAETAIKREQFVRRMQSELA